MASSRTAIRYLRTHNLKTENPRYRPSEILRQVEATLRSNGFNYIGWIDSMQQVCRLEKRQRGESFSLQEHARGLVLAQLSNQRPWGPIAENLDSLSQIFMDFDPFFPLG